MYLRVFAINWTRKTWFNLKIECSQKLGVLIWEWDINQIVLRKVQGCLLHNCIHQTPLYLISRQKKIIYRKNTHLCLVSKCFVHFQVSMLLQHCCNAIIVVTSFCPPLLWNIMRYYKIFVYVSPEQGGQPSHNTITRVEKILLGRE